MGLDSGRSEWIGRVVLGGLLAMASVMLPACVGTLPPDGVKQLKSVDESYRQGDYPATISKADSFLAAHGGVEVAGEAYYVRGLAHLRMKDRARAQQDFEQAVRRSRRADLAPLARVALGNLLFEHGQSAAAAGQYAQAVEKLPNESPKDVVLYRLGVSCARQGQWQAGKTWFSQLMLLFPTSPWEPNARRYFAANGYMVQCGAYSDYTRAAAQVEYLRTRGVSARWVQDKNMKYHLVQVGPYQTYTQAQATLAKVAGLVPDAIIVP